MSALGLSGAGHIATFGGKQYVFMAWTQGMMDAFEEWLVSRIREDAMVAAGENRKRARKLWRDVRILRERNADVDGNAIGDEERNQLEEEFQELAGEAQALEIEGRDLLNRINEKKAAGYYHFFGQLAREARAQFAGRSYLAYLSLLPKQPKITLAEVEEIARKYWGQLEIAMTEAQNETAKKSSECTDATQDLKTMPSANQCTPAANVVQEKISP